MESWVVATGLVFLYVLVTIVLGFLANRAMTPDLEDFRLYGPKAGFVVPGGQKLHQFPKVG